MAERSQYDSRVHDDSASDGEAVTPSDTDKLRGHARGLYVGVTGDVRVTFLSGRSETFVGVLGGTLLPVRIDQVRSTGTTAGSMLALY